VTTAVGMRTFLWRWHRWLLGTVFLLAVSVAALFVAEDADGSKAALEQVQLGMTREQALAVLSRAHPNGHHNGSRPAGFLRYFFREHSVFVSFDNEDKVIAKSRQENVPRELWWEGPLARWNRIKAALGL